MKKSGLTEADILTKYITPAQVDTEWFIQKQIHEEKYFNDGRIRVRGSVEKRDKGKKAD